MKGRPIGEALDPSRPFKPLDIGEAGLAASIGPGAGISIVTAGHPDWGATALAAGPRFAESDRYDPRSVRAFRRRLVSPRAPSLRVRGGAADGPEASAMSLLDGVLPVARIGRDGPHVVSFVPHPQDADGARGIVQFAVDGEVPPTRWSGTIRFGRADYAELTEGRPVAPDRGRARASAHPTGLVIDEPVLGRSVALTGHVGRGDVRQAEDGRWRIALPVTSGARVLVVATGSDRAEAVEWGRALTQDPAALLARTRVRWRDRLAWIGDGPDGLLARRGLAYAIGCCAVPVGDATCLITDHMLLPLAWTRDAYFVAQALLRWSVHTADPEGVELVRRHLTWLFTVADRPEGWWARSHLIHGQRKDPAYQLDQQLYPILELVEYTVATRDRRPLDMFGHEIARAIEAIEGRRPPMPALYATEENAADDPADLPYQTANQILVWHTLRGLDGLGFGGGRLGRVAERVRSAIHDRLVVAGPDGQPVYAYAGDGHGRHRLYHDANDVPLAMAPVWGFCAVTDPIWRATVDFAFSSANPGYFSGPFGGLGSDHTSGTWPLGVLQRTIIERAIGDRVTAQRGMRSLADLAYRDGALPEANDPRTGRPISRAWFSWPSALTFSEGVEPTP
jgi:hypothetical protein